MARASRRAAKKNVVSIDFTDVESGGGGSFHIKAGEYAMKVKSVEDTESDAGNQMFKWAFEGTEGAAKGKVFYVYTVYDPPTSLWKLKGLLEALAVEVPDGAMDLDLDEMVDLELIGIVEDDEYNGKTVSRLNDFAPVDGEEEEEEEKPARGRKGRAAKEDEEEEKPTRSGKGGKGKKLDAISAEELKAMEKDDLEDVIERYELDVDPKEHKTPRRLANAVIAALEEKELLADE
jgi:hypothetical protein